MLNAQMLALQRKRLADMMPDTCSISYETAGTVNLLGVPTAPVVTLRQYQGLTAIPCRVDIARAFRPDKLKEQVINIDEYIVTLPYDVVVEHDDTITVGSDVFRIKRLDDLSTWRAFKEALCTRVSFE